MKQRIPSKQRGFVLLYVVVTITLVAAIAFALNNQGATRTNIASGELQRDQLRYVAEAGIAHATLQLSQSTTCDGYTDVPSTPFGAGTYTATITPTSSSPVTITATGTLASGAKNSLTRNGLKVYDSEGFQRITLQPGAEGVDTYIEFENPSNDYGDQNILMSDGEEAGKGPIRSLLQFDLSGIPNSLAVVSAVLSVYVKEDANDEVVVEAHRLLQSWAEGTGSNDGATWNTTDGSTPWNNPGTDYDSAVEGSFPVTSLGWKSMYITSLVQSWVDGSQPNDGLVLLTPPTAGNNDITYHSSDESDPSLRPKLNVTVACECGQTCLGDDNFLVISTDGDAELGGLAFLDTDLVRYDRNADTATLFLDGLSAGLSKKVDALHVLKNGNLILSVDGGTTFAGLSVASEDLFEYDPVAGTATMYLEADVHFESKKNIISAHILDNGNVVLSTDGSATLGGLTFSDKDLVEYNRFTGEASIYFDGDATTLSQRISALHILNDGRLVLTADGDTTLGGLSFRQDQLIEYDPVADSAILFFDGETLFTETSEKIRALHIGSGSGSSVPSVGTQHVLFVVGNGANLTNEELAHRNLLESWDYSVELIDDDASQTAFDAAVATNDLVFTTNDITANNLGTKLVDATIGVVTSEDNLSDEFGLSSGIAWNSGTSISVDDNTHYITEPFPVGTLTVFSGSQSLAYVTGTLAPDLGQLASSTSGPALVTLEAGATIVGGGSAAGRRAQLPWGGSGFDPNNLNPNGLTILRRALEWGAGAVVEPHIHLSTDGDATLGGLSFQDTDVVKYQPSADLASLYLDSLAAGLSKKVDALHILANGRLVLSTEADTTFGGLTFKSDDLIEYDPVAGSATMYLEAAVHFDSMKDIISVHVLDNGNVVLSTNGNAVLGGLAFSDRDLVEYDRDTGTASIFFDGDAVSLSQRISALHILDNGNLVIAPEGDTTLGGLDIGADQLVEYNPTLDLAVLYFDGETLFSETSEKVRSVHIGPGSGSSAPLPLAHWKLDETAGVTAVDSIGSHDGTLTNGPIWTSGTIDGGLEFDGSNDHVRVSDSSDLHLAEGTIQVWINADTISGEHYLFHKAGSEKMFVLIKSGEITYETNGDTLTSPIQANRWYRVTVTFGSEGMKLYLDGSLVTSNNKTDGMVDNSDSIYIGADDTLGKAFDGTMDDIRIYDVALSADEIAASGDSGGGGGGGGPSSGTYRDEFNARSYSGSDGTLSWSTDWLEVGEGNGPTSGDEQVRSDSGFDYVLRVRDNDNGGEGVEREADLSACSAATLSFDYRRKSFDSSSDYVTVDVSANGGGSWTEIGRLAGPADESSYQPVNYNISTAMASNTRIRFLTSSSLGGSDELFVDNVEIACTP